MKTLSLARIWTIAVFEFKTLSRSWFFRIFATLSVVLLALANYFLFMFQRSSPWTFRCIPSSIPYFDLSLINVVQAVIGIFMASNFLKTDRKMDSTDVIYTRSVTNAEYVVGKSMGIFALFVVLNTLVLGTAFVFNFFFLDVPVRPAVYLYYPLLVSVPTILYIFGLSFLLMVLLKSQALTIIILLGYITATVFFLGGKLYGLFDYMSYQTPLMFSDFIGFGNVAPILVQRGIYVCLGLGFIFITVLFIKRLPQSRIVTIISGVLGVMLIVIGIGLGATHVAGIRTARDMREEIRRLNTEAASKPTLSVETCDIDLRHDGDIIEASAELACTNDTGAPLDTYLLSLNPGLDVVSITTADGSALQFERTMHLITVTPSSPVPPGGTTVITVTYRGSIDERACYVDIEEDLREENNRLLVYKIDKRYGIVNPDYVLLTPETAWYPVAGPPYAQTYPEIQGKDFATFTLTVSTRDGLTAISQGAAVSPGPGTFTFKPDKPMSRLSLTIGEYEKMSVTAGGVEYSVYVRPGNDYFSEHFAQIGDQLPETLTELRNNFANDMGLTYPYSRLAIVETPVQFYSYERFWTLGQETVQPEVVFMPERGFMIFEADFKMQAYWRSQGRGRRFGDNSTQTPEEQQADMLRQFARGTLLSDRSSRMFSRQMRRMRGRGGISIQQLFFGLMPRSMPNYFLFPNLYNYTNSFSSEEYPVFNLVVEHFLRTGRNQGMGRSFRFGRGLTEEEEAAMLLNDASLSDLIGTKEDTYALYYVFKLKSDYLFSMINAEVDQNDFLNYFYGFVERNRFRTVPVSDFVDSLDTRFGFDLKPHLDAWFTDKGLPGYIISDITTGEVIEGALTRSQIIFTITNVTSAPGLVAVSVRGGPELPRYVRLEGDQTKEVGIVIDDVPRGITFQTMISRNIPATINLETPPVEKGELYLEPFDGEVVLDSAPPLTRPGEILVDNENPGFEVLTQPRETLLRKILSNRGEADENAYDGFNFWRPPQAWTPAIEDNFYGQLRKTASYIRGGEGDQKVRWTAEIPESGKYDVLAYTPRMRRMSFRGRGGDSPIDTFQYIVHHDDGEDTVEIDVGKAEEDWSYLGTFYISEGTTSVVLTDKTKGRVVYADAVKWVKK